jgi:hypothetical protein
MSTLSQAGKTLGSAKSPAKAAAAKANGAKGGRPKGSASNSTNKKDDKEKK